MCFLRAKRNAVTFTSFFSRGNKWSGWSVCICTFYLVLSIKSNGNIQLTSWNILNIKYSETKHKFLVLLWEHHTKVHSKYNKTILLRSLEIFLSQYIIDVIVTHFKIYKLTNIGMFGKTTTEGEHYFIQLEICSYL